MDFIVTNSVALEAAAILIKDQKTALLSRFPAAMIRAAEACTEVISVEKEMQILEWEEPGQRPFGAVYYQALGEGGIFTALWKLAEQMKSGLEVDLRKIPVKQETIEICEYFGINPYNALSGGALLIAAEYGQILIEEFKKEGIESTFIGRVTAGNDRIIWNDGHKRYLDRPGKEELYKLYKEGWSSI